MRRHDIKFLLSNFWEYTINESKIKTKCKVKREKLPKWNNNFNATDWKRNSAPKYFSCLKRCCQILWPSIVEKKKRGMNLNKKKVCEWTRISKRKAHSTNKKKVYTLKILYARNTIAQCDTQIICVIFVRGCGYSSTTQRPTTTPIKLRRRRKKKHTHTTEHRPLRNSERITIIIIHRYIFYQKFSIVRQDA